MSDWMKNRPPHQDAPPWRSDPRLAGRFEPNFPDDLRVMVHDGEPRRVQRGPELCWVRISARKNGRGRNFIFNEEASRYTADELTSRFCDGINYVGELLNAPYALKTISKGDWISFYPDVGLEHPLMITDAYRAERARWWVQPCNTCGFAEGLDPPSVMWRTRFADQPADAVMDAFTAFCPACGGVMLFSQRDE